MPNACGGGIATHKPMNHVPDRDVLEGYPWTPRVVITDPSKAVDPQSVMRWGSMMGPRARADDDV